MPGAELEGLPDGLSSVGVTGTRTMLPRVQYEALGDALEVAREAGASRLHHGCCTGTDGAAHSIGHHLGYRLTLHMPLRTVYLAAGLRIDPAAGDRICEPKNYADRNRDIAFEADALLACPRFPEDHPLSERSGTWQTVRFARSYGTPVWIIDRNGKITPDRM